MTSMTVTLWAMAAVLVALALVAALLPPTRTWHRWGVGVLVLVAVLGVASASLSAWSGSRISEEDLVEATESATGSLDGVAGEVTQRRIMAAVTDELGRSVFAEPADRTAAESTYDVRPEGEESPTVCVTVAVSAGTATAVQTSSVRVEPGSC